MHGTRLVLGGHNTTHSRPISQKPFFTQLMSQSVAFYHFKNSSIHMRIGQATGILFQYPCEIP